MKFPKPHTLKEIAELIGSTYVGADDFPVEGMNEIHVVTPGDIVFVDHPKYYDKALESAATVVLINKEVDCPEGKALLVSEDPFRDFNTLTRHFMPFVSASALIAPTASIGHDTQIQPGAFIGNNVTIGANCVIHANVTCGARHPEFCQFVAFRTPTGHTVVVFTLLRRLRSSMKSASPVPTAPCFEAQ